MTIYDDLERKAKACIPNPNEPDRFEIRTVKHGAYEEWDTVKNVCTGSGGQCHRQLALRMAEQNNLAWRERVIGDGYIVQPKTILSMLAVMREMAEALETCQKAVEETRHTAYEAPNFDEVAVDMALQSYKDFGDGKS